MRNRQLFISVYLFLLIIDILSNFIPGWRIFRAVTSPLLIISLIVYFHINSQSRSNDERLMVFTALFSMLLGDLFLYDRLDVGHFFVGLVAFTIANVSYATLFYQSAKLSIRRTIPFMIAASLLTMVLLYFMYDILAEYYLPVLIYFFALLNNLQAAYMRFDSVEPTSFYLIFIGMLLFISSQVFIGLKQFIVPAELRNTLIIFCFGLSQLLIINGILAEKQTVNT